MKTIVCKICGKTVERARTNQKYCPDCRAEAYKADMKRWRWENPERCVILQRQYHLKHADKIREQQHQYYLAQVAKKRARKELSP